MRPMRACVSASLLLLGGWAALAGAVMAYLQRAHGQAPPATLGVSLIAGGVAWVAAGLLWGSVRALRERSALAKALRGEPPVDGRITALAGRLEPTGRRLTSPLGGAECVLYGYEILVDRGSGKRRTIAPCYRGVALAPSAVVTATGTYRLLAVPDLAEVEGAALSRDAALARATDLVRRTTFRPKSAAACEREECWSDDDGSYRSDVSYVEPGETLDLAECRFEERHVRPGAPVCVIGPFSESRGGIVPHPNLFQPVRLVPGDTARVASALVASAFRRLGLGLLAGAVAAGVVAAFLSR
jgi:hypothetical protein